MEQVEEKDKVAIAYVGKLDDGTVFTTVTSDKPLEIVMGNLEAPPTLENALLGMKVGEKKQVRIDPEENYGLRQKDLLQKLKKDQLGEAFNESTKVGSVLSLKIVKDGQEHTIPATIVEIQGDIITIDYNHPLAGHHLTYHVEIIDIEKQSAS